MQRRAGMVWIINGDEHPIGSHGRVDFGTWTRGGPKEEDEIRDCANQYYPNGISNNLLPILHQERADWHQ